MKFYIIKIFDMETGEQLISSGYTSKSDCIWFLKQMEKHYNKELDYKINEVDI